MGFLTLSVVCSALLVVFFKIFEKYNVPVFQAIVFNYISATICAFFFLPDKEFVTTGNIVFAHWFPFAFLLGSLFIVIFNLTSIATLRYGISTASIAMKLGLIFPVLFAFIIYGEPFNWLKLIGIGLAFVAVVLSSIKEEPKSKDHHSSFAWLPLIVFLGSGLCDSLTQFANKKYLHSSGMEEFSFILFLAAAVGGSSILIFQMVSGKTTFHIHSMLGGILLGIINYFSFLFILKALANVSWGSSVVFPVSNLGTVAVATLTGIILFKEQLSRINILGLIFAAASIILIIFASL
ncbi:MAG: DMT family transporter [Bacteroidetes bacterium]|nr:DMT family transporter [Bacteroidota bacterium]MBK8658368.1 DMT family transporter [Bacteroidota bacterium]